MIIKNEDEKPRIVFGRIVKIAFITLINHPTNKVLSNVAAMEFFSNTKTHQREKKTYRYISSVLFLQFLPAKKKKLGFFLVCSCFVLRMNLNDMVNEAYEAFETVSFSFSFFLRCWCCYCCSHCSCRIYMAAYAKEIHYIYYLFWSEGGKKREREREAERRLYCPFVDLSRFYVIFSLCVRVFRLWNLFAFKNRVKWGDFNSLFF